MRLFGRRKTEGSENEQKKFKKANLGLANQMYYNEELKMWVERGKEDEARAEKDKLSAPPPSVGSMSAASSSTSLVTTVTAAEAAQAAPAIGAISFTRDRSLKGRYIATPGAGAAASPTPANGSISSSGPSSGKSLLPGGGAGSMLPGIPKIPGRLGAGSAVPLTPAAGLFFVPTPAASEVASDAAGDNSSTQGSMSLSQSGLSMDAFLPGNSKGSNQPSFFMPSTTSAGGAENGEESNAVAANGTAKSSSRADGDSSSGGSSRRLPALAGPGNLSFANWQPLSPKQQTPRLQQQQHNEQQPAAAGQDEEPEVSSPPLAAWQHQQYKRPSYDEQQQQEPSNHAAEANGNHTGRSNEQQHDDNADGGSIPANGSLPAVPNGYAGYSWQGYSGMWGAQQPWKPSAVPAPPQEGQGTDPAAWQAAAGDAEGATEGEGSNWPVDGHALPIGQQTKNPFVPPELSTEGGWGASVAANGGIISAGWDSSATGVWDVAAAAATDPEGGRGEADDSSNSHAAVHWYGTEPNGDANAWAQSDAAAAQAWDGSKYYGQQQGDAAANDDYVQQQQPGPEAGSVQPQQQQQHGQGFGSYGQYDFQQHWVVGESSDGQQAHDVQPGLEFPTSNAIPAPSLPLPFHQQPQQQQDLNFYQPLQQHQPDQQRQQPYVQPLMLDPVHPSLPGIATSGPSGASDDYVQSSSHRQFQMPGSAAAAAARYQSAPGGPHHSAGFAPVSSGGSPPGSAAAGTFTLPVPSRGASMHISQAVMIPPPPRTVSMHSSPGKGSLLLPAPRPSYNGSTGSLAGSPSAANSAALTLSPMAVAGDASMLTAVRPSSPYARPVSPLARTNTGMSDHSTGSGGHTSNSRAASQGFPIPSPPSVQVGRTGTFIPGATQPAVTSVPWRPNVAGEGDSSQSANQQQQQQQGGFGPPVLLNGYMGRLTGMLGAIGELETDAGLSSGATQGSWLSGHDSTGSAGDAAHQRDRRVSYPATTFMPTAVGFGAARWQDSSRAHSYDKFIKAAVADINWKVNHYKEPGKLSKLLPWQEFERERELQKEQEEGHYDKRSIKDAFWYKQMEHRRKLPADVLKPATSEPAAMPSHIAAAAAGPTSPGSGSSRSQSSHITGWQHSRAAGVKGAAGSAPSTPVHAATTCAIRVTAAAGSNPAGEATPTSKFVPQADAAAAAAGGQLAGQQQHAFAAGAEAGYHAVGQQDAAMFANAGQQQQQHQEGWPVGGNGSYQQQPRADGESRLTPEQQQWQLSDAYDQHQYYADQQQYYACQQYYEQYYQAPAEQMQYQGVGDQQAYAEQQVGQEGQQQQQPDVQAVENAASQWQQPQQQDVPLAALPAQQLDAEAAAAIEEAARAWDSDIGALEGLSDLPELSVSADGAAVDSSVIGVAQNAAAAGQPAEASALNLVGTIAAAAQEAGSAIQSSIGGFQPNTAKVPTAAAQQMVDQAVHSTVDGGVTGIVDTIETDVDNAAGIVQGDIVGSFTGIELAVGVVDGATAGGDGWEVDAAVFDSAATEAADSVAANMAAVANQAAAEATADAEQASILAEEGEGAAVVAAEGGAEAAYSMSAYPKDWMKVRQRLADVGAGFDGDMATYREYFFQYGDYLFQFIGNSNEDQQTAAMSSDGAVATATNAAAEAAAVAANAAAATAELEHVLELFGEQHMKANLTSGLFRGADLDLDAVLDGLALA